MIKAFTYLAAGACLASASQDYPKVPVEVFYEAQCPGCQQFITGPLTLAWAESDIWAITDLKMVPYGNTKKNSDGTYTCQHGAGECASDVIELCTLYKLSGNMTSISDGSTSEEAFSFIRCMEIAEGDPLQAESCFASSMKNSDLLWETVDACTQNEANDVQAAGAAATPSHDYVPWVLVDGELLENTNRLIASICDAYTGPKPESCRDNIRVNTAPSTCGH